MHIASSFRLPNAPACTQDSIKAYGLTSVNLVRQFLQKEAGSGAMTLHKPCTHYFFFQNKDLILLILAQLHASQPTNESLT